LSCDITFGSIAILFVAGFCIWFSRRSSCNTKHHSLSHYNSQVTSRLQKWVGLAFYFLGVASCCVCCYDLFWGAVNRSNLYFLILLFTSQHVSASTGHPQVKYTIVF
jgi:hypothetical protein